MPDSNIFSGVFGGLFSGNGSSSSGPVSFYDFSAGSLPSNVTFTRASSGYRYNSAGVLVSETTDTARFQYDPATFASRGLLVEDAATNNFQRSEEFDNVYWTKSLSTITADAVAAPNGATTADKLVETAASGAHVTSRSISITSGAVYSFSVFFKADTRTWACLTLGATGFGSTLRTYFDIGTGAVGTTGAGVTAYIQNIGSGWYRCTVIATATATAATAFSIELASSGSVVSYAGDGTSGLYIWGANLTDVGVTTSYIQTVSAAATRAADVALITNVAALADQCWIVKGRTPRKIASGAVNVAFQADDGSANNRRVLRYGTDSRLHVIATVAGVDQCDLDLGAVAADTDFAVAIRWADNNFAASLNGGAIVTDVSGSNPLGLTTVRVGRGATGSYWGSTIRSIRTQATATDTELPLLAA